MKKEHWKIVHGKYPAVCNRCCSWCEINNRCRHALFNDGFCCYDSNQAKTRDSEIRKDGGKK